MREEWRVFCSPVPSRFADVRERTALASAMAKVGRKSVGEGPGTWACVHAFNDAGGKNTLLLYLNNQRAPGACINREGQEWSIHRSHSS